MVPDTISPLPFPLFLKGSAISAGLKGAFYVLPKLAGKIYTITGENLAAYPGLAGASADALETGAALTTTAGTIGAGISVGITAIGAFSTTADFMARYACQDIQ